MMGATCLGQEEGAKSELFWLKAGPVYRGGMKADASGSSHTQNQGTHALGALQSPAGVGSAGSFADRTYDDGYVRRDPGTGIPSTIDPNVTWYWGYDNGAQYDADAETLTFHRTGTEGYQKTLDAALDADDTMAGYGAELVGGLPLKDGKFSLALCLGLQGIFDADASLDGSTYEEGVGRLDVRDTYDVSGVSIPSAGFRGTYDGPFGTPPVIPSPVIPNRPTSRSSSLTDMKWSARNAISMDAKTDLLELWLGPRLALQASDRISVNLTPKVSVNYVDVSVDRSETFVATDAAGRSATLDRWTDSGSETEFIFGAGATAGVDVEITDHLFAGVWGGYEWVSDEVDVTVGPNTVSVDASGYTAGAAAGYRF